jgi:hypothetical protein
MQRTHVLTLIVAAVLLALAAAVIAQMKLVTYKDGRTVVGTTTQKGDKVEITTETGQVLTTQAADVASIANRMAPKEEYKQRLLALKFDDAEGHYELGVWCQKKALLKEAQSEMETVLKLQPKHENAMLRLDQIKRALADTEKPRPDGNTGQVLDREFLKQLMTEPDMQRIRLAELRSSDKGKVAITFQNDVLRRFVDRVRGRGDFTEIGYENEFLRNAQTNPVGAVVKILEMEPNAKDLQADIILKSNPGFMKTFKTGIWPTIQGNCASMNCHGAPSGQGRLKLYNLRGPDDAIFFTNFYILDSYDGPRGKLINRGQPAQSLLLQFGLPEDIARMRHPVAKLPMYNSYQDRRYVVMDEWIRSLLNPHPTYDVTYKAPGAPAPAPAAPESQPAAPAASAAPAAPAKK